MYANDLDTFTETVLQVILKIIIAIIIMQLVGTKHESSALLTVTHLNFKQSHGVRISNKLTRFFRQWSQASGFNTSCGWPPNKKIAKAGFRAKS